MENVGYFVIVVTVFVVGVSFVLSLRAGGKTASTDWNIAGRELPIYVIIGTQFASAMGGGVVVGQVGNAYDNGIVMVCYGLFASLPFLTFLIIGRWIRSQEFETIPDMIFCLSHGSEAAKLISAILTMIVPFGWLISQLVAFAKIYSGITHAPVWLLIIAMAVVSLLFVLPSGMKTVAWTDFFFSCVMIVICIVVVVYCVHSGATVETITRTIPIENSELANGIRKIGLGTLITWFVACLPGGMTNQMYFQRVCALRRISQVNQSLIVSAIALFLAFLWSCYLGNAIRFLQPGLAGEDAAGWLLSVMPTAMIAIFAALITATILSTISSAVQSVVVNCTHDIYSVFSSRPDGRQVLWLSRGMSVLVLAVAAFLGIKTPRVLEWIVNTYAYSAAGLCVPMYVGYICYKKNSCTTTGIIASMICGMVGCIGGQLINSRIPFVIIGISFSFIALLIGNLVGRRWERR